MVKKWVTLCAFSIFSVTVNNAAIEYKLNFAVGPHAFYIPQGRFFIASPQAGAGESAIAAAVRGALQFKPLACEKIVLNNIPNQDNPLFNAPIGKLAAVAYRVLATTSNTPGALYALDDMINRNSIELFSIGDIKNAQGITAPVISAIASTHPITLEEPETLLHDMGAFVALPNNAGNFNGEGSGLAVLLLEPQKVKQDDQEKTTFVWSAYNAQTGEKNGNKAFAITRQTPEIAINSAATEIAQVTDMFYDSNLKILYIAFDAQSGSQALDGVRSIVAATALNGTVKFAPIAADSAFDNTNKIVGGRGALERFIIKRVLTLTTTTHMRYLIVVTSNNTVHALPLVDNFASAAHGTLASIKSPAIDVFSQGAPMRFSTRVFLQPAQNPEDLYSIDSLPGLVGADSNLPGTISDIVVSKDAVLVSVNQDGNNQQAGIFISQALFDVHGRIRGWTRWQRSSTTQKTTGLAFDPVIANTWFLPTDSQGGTTGDIVNRTIWSAGSEFEKFVAQEFSQATGGVQGLQDFPYTTASFSNAIGNRIALQVLTGFKKVMLMQTGKDINSLFGPESEQNLQSRIFKSSDGTLSGFAPSFSTIELTGGVLNQVGPLVASAIITDGTFGWLAVGGSCGLAILSKADGTGWDAIQGLGTDFSGLTADMAFRLVGSFRNIRKITALGNILYVLTSTGLYKLIINAQDLGHSGVSVTQLAQAQTGSFSDMILSGPLALLATSTGLYRSGNSVDIRMVQSPDELKWTPVVLPESVGSFKAQGPVSRLFAISHTGHEADVSNGGNIYVLNAYVGFKQAQIYRLALQLDNNTVTDTSVQLLPDLFIKDRATFFANLGDYRNYIVTDGSFIGVTRSAYNGQSPFIEILPPKLTSGERFGARNGAIIAQQDGHSIGLLTRNSASGDLVLPGDFGIRING